ncbi:hypothetical protein [uncultured Brachyspira sp.]|uniref:hypothetical protein n=1 Tax=uncultured Brachyspira sp. TaxID=221953 RepID=UPI002625868E|nr:hypothetical protein [uncultured Brachyspira sp.]
MPKPIFNTTQSQKIETNVSTSKKNGLKVDEKVLREKLRKKRSDKYMEAIKALDAGDVMMSQKQKEELLSTIKEEFADVSSIFVESNLIGVLGKCYLGDTYDVHTLDISGIMIIEHYKSNQKLPNGFESARSLCQHPQYEFIEVYEKFMIAVMSDGSTAVISK